MESFLLVDRLYDYCGGGNGRFQKIFCLLISSCFNINTFFSFGFTFYELYPKLQCQDESNGEWARCEREMACSEGSVWRYDWDDPDSIHNWVEQYDLLCEPKVQIGMLGTLLFFGYTCGTLCLSRFGDIFGRKTLMLPMLCLEAFFWLLSALCSSFLMLKVSIFGLAFVGMPCVVMAYTMAMELVSLPHQPFYTFLVMVLGGFTQISFGVFFTFVKRMHILTAIKMVQYALLIPTVWYWLPESPKFLFEKNKMKEFYQTMVIISKWNGVELTESQIEAKVQQLEGELHQIQLQTLSTPMTEAEDHTQGKGEHEVSHLFFNHLYLWNLIALCMNWSASSCSFYFIEFYMKYMPINNIFLMSALIGCFDIIASYLYLVSSKFSLDIKGLLVIAFFIQAASAGVTAAMQAAFDAGIISSASVLFMTMGILMRGLSNVSFCLSYLANAQYFPPLLRSAVFGMTNVVSRMATATSPMIVELVPNPAISIVIMSVASMLLSLRLRKPF